MDEGNHTILIHGVNLSNPVILLMFFLQPLTCSRQKESPEFSMLQVDRGDLFHSYNGSFQPVFPRYMKLSNEGKKKH